MAGQIGREGLPYVQLKGSVEKGGKWWFQVKIKIGAIQLNIGTQASWPEILNSKN